MAKCNELCFRGNPDWRQTQAVTVSVLGSHEYNAKVAKLSHKVGKIIAKVGATLVCGGLGGVMEHVSRGAKDAGGMTIGLLPGKNKGDANPYIDIALPTSIGYARNACIACSADVVVALPGSYGTESEICYAIVYGRPVIDMGGWGIKGMIKVKNIDDFERVLKQTIKKVRS